MKRDFAWGLFRVGVLGFWDLGFGFESMAMDGGGFGIFLCWHGRDVQIDGRRMAGKPKSRLSMDLTILTCDIRHHRELCGMMHGTKGRF